MQEHVKFEIALELLIKDIANVIQKIDLCDNKEERKKLEEELHFLLEAKDEAYAGNKKVILNILNKEG
jgi:hypothetical protein